MLGTIVNIVAVAAGSAAGLMIHSRLPRRVVDIVFQGLGLVTMAIGISMSIRSDRIIFAVASVVAGAVIGELLRLEERLDRFAEKIKKGVKAEGDRFTEGFVTASMLYCVGAMTILGSIEDGMGMEPRLLLTKSLMDGMSSIALAASFGIGVLFSIIPIFVIQGLITLFAGYFSRVMSQTMTDDLTCVGGILLLGLAINILGIKKISVVNMLPALVLIVLVSRIFG